MPSNPQERQSERAGRRQGDDRGEGAGKHHRSEQLAGEDDDLRPQNRGYDAAGEHEGDGSGLELRRRIVGSGEAELLNEGAADADQEEAERKQPEARLK